MLRGRVYVCVWPLPLCSRYSLFKYHITNNKTDMYTSTTNFLGHEKRRLKEPDQVQALEEADQAARVRGGKVIWGAVVMWYRCLAYGFYLALLALHERGNQGQVCVCVCVCACVCGCVHRRGGRGRGRVNV
jgi:hypothetical protein